MKPLILLQPVPLPISKNFLKYTMHLVNTKMENLVAMKGNIEEELSSKVMNNINRKSKIIKYTNFYYQKKIVTECLVLIEKKDNRSI